MSAWQKYVEYTLGKERSLIFDKEELEVIDALQTELRKQNRLETWDELDLEWRLNVIRGYWDRAHRVRDMAQACVEIYDWRKANGMDSILTSRMPLHEEYHACWPSYIGGEDKYGHWIVFDKVNDLDVSALSRYDEETVLKYRAQCLEAFVRIKMETSLRLGHRVCQYIYVIDLTGLSLKKHFTAKVRAILQPLFRISGDYYPDTLWGLYILNAPMSFRMVWSVISPWVDPVVKAKIRILSGESKYLPAMQKADIPLASIPRDLGGEGSVVSLKSVVERLIDDPDTANHGFTSNPVPPDPAAVKAFKADQALLARRPSLMGRMAKARNVKTFKKRLSLGRDSLDTSSDAVRLDGDEVYEEDEVAMQGWMSKQGAMNTSWKRRYFVLTSSALYYFDREPSSDAHVPRGKIELHMILGASVHSAPDAADGLLDIATPRRVYQLRVEPQDMSHEAYVDEGAEAANTVGVIARRWVEEVALAAQTDQVSLDAQALHDKGNENHVRAGFLFKRGAFNPAWRKRYFVLTSHALYYYTDKPTSVGSLLKGRVQLSEVVATDVTKAPREFVVAVPGRVRFLLRAESEAAADGWLTDISTAAEREHEARARRVAAGGKDGDSEDGAYAGAPVVRDLDEEAESVFGRTPSAMIAQVTGLAGEFLAVAADMRILRKDLDEPPDQETMLQDVRKRVLHMFKLF